MHFHSIIEISNVIGMLGVIIILYAYSKLQTGYMLQTDKIYSILNFIGSTFILFSLFFTWNTASVVIEAAWVLISLYGVVKPKTQFNVTRREANIAE